jgi:hypothetical protein
MDKTFINKHRFGIVALLFFILLTSQEKSLRFLTHTILGRLSLIFLLLGISTFSIVLGVIAVLFVIIMVNKDDSFYLEAFDPAETSTDKKVDLTPEQQDNLKKMKDKLKAKKEHQGAIADASVAAAVTGTETFRGGREGYNTMDRERNLQLGKCSNQVSVGNINQNTENVIPFEQISSTPSKVE